MSKPLQIGDRVPQVTFRLRDANGWVDRSSADVFDGRTVIAFALPGAFTPTCSGSQVPGYDAYAGEFARLGVDEIVCISVNDGFVMHAWARELGVQHVHMLADGNAEFTRAMGMLVDKDDLGFGARSWRYSMLVRDGVISQLFAEPRVPGDPYGASSPETMLAHLAPDAPRPDDIVLVTREGCGHCTRAKQALAAAGKPYEEVRLGGGLSVRGLRALSGQATTPQVFVNGACIGGADELEALLRRAEGIAAAA
jgi:glutaredoxin-like protein